MPGILVTGANGVAGRALVGHLRSRGQAVQTIGGQADCDLENGDDTLAYFQRACPDRVYHLAGAVFGVGGNTAFPGDAFRRNTLINVNVIEAARRVGVSKILGMGSTAVYADGLNQPMSEADALAREPHASEYAYAFAKRGLLVQLESYKRQFGLDYVYAISTNLYGPHDRFNSDYGHVIPSLLSKFEAARDSGETVSIWGDGSPTRDFLYSSDAARGLVTMMENGSGRYNLASGSVHSIRDLVETISASYPGVPYSWDTTKPLGQLSRSYDVSRLTSLGFSCEFPLQSGIAATIAWVRDNLKALRT